MEPYTKDGPHDSLISLGQDSTEHQDTQSNSSLPNAAPEQTHVEPPSPRHARSRRQSRSQSQKSSPAPSFSERAYTTQETQDAFDQAEQGIDVESENTSSDFDDGYESDSSTSDSISLISSARQFIYENGRRYHGYRAEDNPYSFPNDDREQDREDLKHAMYLLLFNKTLHFAPLNVERSGMKVIDLGTGTGIWAIDFADQYPSAEVLGVDLSPIQTNWVPPNLKFMVDDVEVEWLYPSNHFDYIHTRHTVQAFRNWEQLISRAYKHLKPGGWIEMQEINHYPECDDGTMAADNPIAQYWGHIATALSRLGIDLHSAPRLPSLLEAAGFTNIVHRTFYTPIGPWPKNRALREVGLYWRAVLMEGLEAIALGPFTRGLGWRKEEVEVFLVGVRKAYLEKGTHAWMPFHVVYGQKPER